MQHCQAAEVPFPIIAKLGVTWTLALIAIVGGQAFAEEPTTMPRVVATGTFDNGGIAFCFSAGCGLAMVGSTERNGDLALEESLDSEQAIDHEAFCKALKAKRPSNCDAGDPPSTPGLDPGWQPNACGTGGASNLLLDSGMHVVYSDNYSGDFNAPYPGISFKTACDAHDLCWGVAGDRANCDANFDAAMRAACGVLVSPSSNTVCNGFAGAYFSAVATTNIGNQNYAASVAARACAIWAYEIKINGC